MTVYLILYPDYDREPFESIWSTREGAEARCRELFEEFHTSWEESPCGCWKILEVELDKPDTCPAGWGS